MHDTRTARLCDKKTIFMHENVLASIHSVILKPTKLILVGTRTTYQATGTPYRRV